MYACVSFKRYFYSLKNIFSSVFAHERLKYVVRK